MGPRPYMQSVVHRNVVMQRMTISPYVFTALQHGFQEHLNSKQYMLSYRHLLPNSHLGPHVACGVYFEYPFNISSFISDGSAAVSLMPCASS
jgi:hypothetical protein